MTGFERKWFGIGALCTIVPCAFAFYVYTLNAGINSPRVNELRTENAALTAEVRKMKDSHAIDCGAALADAQKQYEGAIALYNEQFARAESLEKIVADIRAQNLKPAEPVKPKPAAPVALPDDSANLYTTLFVQPDWRIRPNEVSARGLFTQTEVGRDLAAHTHLRIWSVDQAEAKPYYKFVTMTPCLLIQKPTGEIVYRECNPTLAKFPHGLRHQIVKTVRQERHGHQPICPGPNCEPPSREQPLPSNEVVLNREPPAVAPPAKEEKKSAVPALLIAGAVAAVTYVVKFGAAARKAHG